MPLATPLYQVWTYPALKARPLMVRFSLFHLGEGGVGEARRSAHVRKRCHVPGEQQVS